MKRWASWVLVTFILGVRASHNNLYKVTLTQKGYIQFLKYEVRMPPLQDFTFCLWLRSTNLSYPHPIFSYSRNETERLVRSWISPPGPFGKAWINLEIRGRGTPGVAVDIVLGRWYHICQSWSTFTGHWATYVNGNLAAAGQTSQLRGLVVPGEGDVVVGQEYTDSDLGLDDGIEGDLFGFNLLSTSAIPWWSRRARWTTTAESALISRGYTHCTAGRGSPLPRDMLLISWAWSPVKVFGGAIIGPARPMCGVF